MEVVVARLGDEARLVMILGEMHTSRTRSIDAGARFSLSLSALVSVRELCGECVARFGF